jgi:hypothetical protein
MVKDAVDSLKSDVFTRPQIKDYILARFGAVNQATIDACIAMCCVNMPARARAPENAKPRLANGQYDFIYTVGRGLFTRYDPTTHGLWELAMVDGRTAIRRVNGEIPPINGQGAIKTLEQQYTRRTRVRDDIQKPAPEVITEYLEKWTTLEHYIAQESAITKLFSQICPHNSDMDDVLIKVAALDKFYSTNIFAPYAVARQILRLDIDKRLSQGDETLVSDIASVKIGEAERNFYSFATKYCHHHNPEAFPIYDSYVDKTIRYFARVDRFALLSNGELRDYHVFKNILNSFRDYYSLTAFSLRDIDLYLWQLGKEQFPNSY